MKGPPPAAGWEHLEVKALELRVFSGAGGGSWCRDALSAFPSAILYLNGDFDGGNFYFTELDAKTVTVSAPVRGREKPSRCSGQNGRLAFLVASTPLPKPGGLRPVTFSL